jgi:hypothetical protein
VNWFDRIFFCMLGTLARLGALTVTGLATADLVRHGHLPDDQILPILCIFAMCCALWNVDRQP